MDKDAVSVAAHYTDKPKPAVVGSKNCGSVKNTSMHTGNSPQQERHVIFANSRVGIHEFGEENSRILSMFLVTKA